MKEDRVKYRELREEVARVARALISSGLVTGTSGNVSARTPEGDVLITPSGLDYEILRPDDVVLVDLDMNVLEGSLVPSTETPMHTGIYRARRNVEAVVHTHSRFATTLACLGWEIPPVHYMLTTLGPDGRIPLAPYVLYGTEQLA
ncbi:MAG TPA: class II aldolase/adducin family protein, partial [Rubrobacteraceae bacterium]|nr:class II aldolase/adducin family protein [Rubrobacteraceae bacterium]